MAGELRVMLEIGTRGKRVVAVAPDWPGLSRGAKTAEDAIERLQSYLPRYARVAQLAGLESELAALSGAEVVEEYPGNGSTDFWGISFAFSSLDRQSMASEELERQLSLMRACWAFFDETLARVSAELRKGPRGGGRERDAIVRHTLGNEREWAVKKLGVQTPDGAILTEAGLAEHRAAYCDAIRALNTQGTMAKTWPLRYLIRHTAFHTMDHAWEMEDRDLGKVNA
jgi:hypothetical protein